MFCIQSDDLGFLKDSHGCRLDWVVVREIGTNRTEDILLSWL